MVGELTVDDAQLQVGMRILASANQLGACERHVVADLDDGRGVVGRKRKAAWLQKKKHVVKRNIQRPDDESL